MKLKITSVEIEGDTSDVCETLAEVMAAMFPAAPQVEYSITEAALSAHETKANHDD